MQSAKRFGLGGKFETTIERIRRSCAHTASQMQCPHHQKPPRVEVEGEILDDLNVEVFTCCDVFQKRVNAALKDVA
jgi:hypothetical protein